MYKAFIEIQSKPQDGRCKAIQKPNQKSFKPKKLQIFHDLYTLKNALKKLILNIKPKNLFLPGEELTLSTCPGWVVAGAAKRCPLKVVGIPVDPPCSAEELVEIIQVTGGGGRGRFSFFFGLWGGKCIQTVFFFF